jgi:glutamate formiminotransferase/formiminotetrahydrofolate cyclodeaminase
VGFLNKGIDPIAVMLSLGLDELAPFKPKKILMEIYVTGIKNDSRLVSMPSKMILPLDETASETPATGAGGGSIAAYVGFAGCITATMVANLSSHKKGWDERWEEFSDWLQEKVSAVLKMRLLRLVDGGYKSSLKGINECN